MKATFYLATIFALLAGFGSALGENDPQRPIRVLTGAPGGGGDFAARIIAQGLTASFGQQVIVDNRGGVLPIEIGSKAPPDGYTLVLDGASLWIEPLIRKTSYEVDKDFALVMLALSSPNVLAVSAALAIGSVKDLIALAKAKPGELNYSSGSLGTTGHLAGELFRAMAGVNIQHVKYKGTGPAINALMGNEVQLSFATPAVMLPHVKSGRIKGLAVTSAEPSALAPGLPTLASALPGYEAVSLYGIFAPTGTPPTVIARINQEIARTLDLPETRLRLLSIGLEPIAVNIVDSARILKAEIAKWRKVIKDAGIHGD